MNRKLKTEEIVRLSPEEFAAADKIPLVVVLDDVRSLHNVGSVFRTADAYRVERIVLCGITATPPNAEIHKTALVAEFTVEWQYAADAVAAVASLKADGYVVLAVEQAEGSISMDDFVPESGRKYAVVLGNEVKGVHQAVVDASDACLELPQFGTKHSLNVSVAAGIVIWEMAKMFRTK